MFGLSASAISGIFGAVSGFIFKSIAISQEIKASERKHQLDAMVAVSTANQARVEQEIALLEAKAKFERTLSKVDPHRSATRRVLAFVMMLSFVSIPVLVAFGPELVWFEVRNWVEEGQSFLFGIFKSASVHHTEVTSIKGLPLSWLAAASEMVSFIITFYFGGSVAKFSNPYAK